MRIAAEQEQQVKLSVSGNICCTISGWSDVPELAGSAGREGLIPETCTLRPFSDVS